MTRNISLFVLWHYKYLTTLLVKSDSDFVLYNLFNSSNIKWSSVLSDILYHSMASSRISSVKSTSDSLLGLLVSDSSGTVSSTSLSDIYTGTGCTLSLFLKLPSFSSLFYNLIFNWCVRYNQRFIPAPLCTLFTSSGLWK